MTNTAGPYVGIVILNWKRPVQILECLSSLREQTFAAVQVVVVDNASDNGSVAAIRDAFPEVTVIENERNLGFAGGSNIGICHLLNRGVDYVLLLNDDTEVAEDMLSRLVSAAEADPRTAILGPSIFYFEPSDLLWSGGGSIDRYGAARHLRVDERAADLATVPVTEVDYVSGCGMLVKRSVLEAVGALDERFFAYFEETELCARARRAGFRIVYVPQARMWHKIGRTERGQSRPYLYLMARNRLLYVRCSASPGAVLVAALDLLRTAASWSLRPRHRHMRPYASALTRGVLDFFIGQFGAPPARI
jgi:GT2 family glycosyltransferase